MPALITRVVKIPWVLPLLEWTDAARQDFPDPKPVIVPQGWKSFIPAQRNMILSFLERNPSQALALAGNLDELKKNSKGKIDTSEPHGNYRTWTKSWEVLAAADSVGASESVKLMLLQGCVGASAAHEFNAWKRALDLPDPREVLAGRVRLNIAKLGERPDRAHTVLMGLVTFALEDPNPQKSAKFWELLEEAWDTPSTHDIVVIAAKQSLRLHQMGYAAPPKLLQKLAPVVAKALAAQGARG